MSINIQKKQKIVSEIKKIANISLSAVIVNINKINSNEINQIRYLGRKNEVYMLVVRNTLLYRAIKNTQFECLKKCLIGSTLIAFSLKHASSAARLLKNFCNKNKNLKIKAASFDGLFLKADKIDYLANQLTHEEAIIKIILVLKELSINKLVRILIAIKNKKEN